MIEEKPYYIYAKDVVEGKIVSGQYIKMSCQRFLDDLKNDKWARIQIASANLRKLFVKAFYRCGKI